jgi:transposase
MAADELWVMVAPLLPAAPSHARSGRPRVPDRAALAGILFVLRTGCPWALLPLAMGCGSGSTCWRRLRDWQAAGVWARLERALPNRLGGADRIDWSRAAVDSTVDSTSVPPQRGGQATGPNPTDRGKKGTKRHLVVDAQGVPLATLLTGANVNDSRVLAEVRGAIPPIHRPPEMRVAARRVRRRRSHGVCAVEARDRGLPARFRRETSRRPPSSGMGSEARPAGYCQTGPNTRRRLWRDPITPPTANRQKP